MRIIQLMFKTTRGETMTYRSLRFYGPANARLFLTMTWASIKPEIRSTAYLEELSIQTLKSGEEGETLMPVTELPRELRVDTPRRPVNYEWVSTDTITPTTTNFF